MGPNLRIEGVRDGAAIELPQDLDAIAITTAKGTVYIDLGEQVENMVLMRAPADSDSSDVLRLILSPMQSGRIAVGVIRTPS
jgi:hypothetical protein